MPTSLSTASNRPENLPSRSRIRNRPAAGILKIHDEVLRGLDHPAGSGMRGCTQDPDPPAGVLDDRQHSVESGLSLLTVFALPRVDDRQMTISLGQTQSSNEEEEGIRKRSVCPLPEVAGSRSVA
jgi:hypothetical protein